MKNAKGCILKGNRSIQYDRKVLGLIFNVLSFIFFTSQHVFPVFKKFCFDVYCMYYVQRLFSRYLVVTDLSNG